MRVIVENVLEGYIYYHFAKPDDAGYCCEVLLIDNTTSLLLCDIVVINVGHLSIVISHVLIWRHLPQRYVERSIDWTLTSTC